MGLVDLHVLGDTASSLGSAVDELMRHQPSLRSEATKAIIKVCRCLFFFQFLFICHSNVVRNIFLKKAKTVVYGQLTFKLCLQCFDAVGWAAGRASGL